MGRITESSALENVGRISLLAGLRVILLGSEACRLVSNAETSNKLGGGNYILKACLRRFLGNYCCVTNVCLL